MQETREHLNETINSVKSADPNDSLPNASANSQTTIDEAFPRCGSGLVAKSFGKDRFVVCSKSKTGGAACYFRYDTDSRGNPKKGCKSCGGRLSTTKTGKKVCADCEEWQ